MINSFFDLISERSTIACLKAGNPPEIPFGKEKTFKFECERTYQASGLGMFLKGTPITITDCYSQHGYNYYVDEQNHIHREKDIC